MKKPSKLYALLITLKALTVGLPTPFGFRLRLKAFHTVKAMHDELESLRLKYQYALETNAKQASNIDSIQRHYEAVYEDARKYSRALKDVANNDTRSEETQAILQGFRR